jgi:hypothetical protein
MSSVLVRPIKLLSALLRALFFASCLTSAPVCLYADNLVYTLDHDNHDFQDKLRQYVYSLDPSELRCLVGWVANSKEFTDIFDDPILGPLLLSGRHSEALEVILHRDNADQIFERYEKAKKLLEMQKMKVTPDRDISLYRDGRQIYSGMISRPLATSSRPNPGGGLYNRHGSVSMELILPEGVPIEIVPIPNTFKDIGHNPLTLEALGLEDLYQHHTRNIGGFAHRNDEILVVPPKRFELLSGNGNRLGISSADRDPPRPDLCRTKLSSVSPGPLDLLFLELNKRAREGDKASQETLQAIDTVTAPLRDVSNGWYHQLSYDAEYSRWSETRVIAKGVKGTVDYLSLFGSWIDKRTSWAYNNMMGGEWREFDMNADDGLRRSACGYPSY